MWNTEVLLQVSRGKEDYANKLCRMLKSSTRKNGGRFKLILGFHKAVLIRDKNALANKIADLGARHDRQQTGQIRRDVFRDIPELSFAWLIPGSEDRWQVMQVYHFNDVTGTLNDIIKEKEGKSREYKTCDAYWLLVVVDFFDRAQDQEIPIEGFDNIRSEVFEKILFYQPFCGQS